MKKDTEKILEIFKLLNSSKNAKANLPYSIAEFKKRLMFMDRATLDKIYATLTMEQHNK